MLARAISARTLHGLHAHAAEPPAGACQQHAGRHARGQPQRAVEQQRRRPRLIANSCAMAGKEGRTVSMANGPTMDRPAGTRVSVLTSPTSIGTDRYQLMPSRKNAAPRNG